MKIVQYLLDYIEYIIGIKMINREKLLETSSFSRLKSTIINTLYEYFTVK